MAATACQKEVILPNDSQEVMMSTRGAADEDAIPGASNNDEDNITDPDNDEDETDVESEEDLEALNSKN
ncbi:hypothetical protein [Lishizhenia tianjinensis]|nr:hypothetical protein [Lishizhenia tianjinensis]